MANGDRLSPPATEPLDPAIAAFVEALARDLAREDHERQVSVSRQAAPESSE
jgi:hypothetical protein